MDQGAVRASARVLVLGARRADIGQGYVPWVVLTDPDGNEFCALQPHNSLIGWTNPAPGAAPWWPEDVEASPVCRLADQALCTK
jgi:hypothetical protein